MGSASLGAIVRTDPGRKAVTADVSLGATGRPTDPRVAVAVQLLAEHPQLRDALGVGVVLVDRDALSALYRL